VITEEINWKTQYIASSQIFKPAVNHLHCVGQEVPLTNADFGKKNMPKAPHTNLAATFPTDFIRKRENKPTM